MAKSTLTFTKGEGYYESGVFQPKNRFNLQMAYNQKDLCANGGVSHVMVLWGHNNDGSFMSEAINGGFDVKEKRFGVDINIQEGSQVYIKICSQVKPVAGTYMVNE